VQCPSCQGSGEHTFLIQTQSPPGTPSQVRMACDGCLGYGFIQACDVAKECCDPLQEVEPCVVISALS
jgi:hypothetical protein